MLTLPLADLNTSSPVKVPETSPAPGSDAVFTPMVTVDGAFPLAEDIVSQAPPSDVIEARLHVSVPDPAPRICTVWDGGLLLLGAKEKLI
jgi:hypothetical protein